MYDRLPDAKKQIIWYRIFNPANILLILLAVPSIVSNILVTIETDLIAIGAVSITLQTIAVGIFLFLPKYEKIAVRALALFLLGYYVYVFYWHPEATFVQTYNVFLYPSFVYVIAGYIEALALSFISISIWASAAIYHNAENLASAFSLREIAIITSAYVAMIFFIHVIDLLAKISTIDVRRQKGELEASNAQYDTVLNSVGDGLIATDKKGVVQFSSQSALELLGLHRGDLFGRPFLGSVFLVDENDNVVRASEHPLNQVISSGEPLVINRASESRYRLMREDRTTFPANLTITPIKMMGEMTGVIILFHDSSQEDRIDHAKSEFVSLASHQLRTPLNVVSWYTEKLDKGKGGKLNERGKGYIEEIKNSNHRMIELVSSILNVSRIELGRLKIKEQQVDIVQLTKQLVKEVEPLAEQGKVHLKAKYFSESYMLENSDAEHTTVIVQNLLSNAIKYTDSGGVIDVLMTAVKAHETLSKKLTIVADEDGMLLQIKDTGIGIPLEQQGQIFGKLFRADNAQALAVNGTGLGLYVTKSLAESLHGAVWFDSTPGKGTSFFLYLPKKTTFADDVAVQTQFNR